MLAVATWNVENRFLPGGASGPRDAAAYERKLTSLAVPSGSGSSRPGRRPVDLVTAHLNSKLLRFAHNRFGPSGSELGTGGFEPPDQGDGQRLWNIAPAPLPSITSDPRLRRDDSGSDHAR